MYRRQEVKYVHVVAHAMTERSSSIEVVGAVMDVTATRQAEMLLLRSEHELSLIVETIPGLVWCGLELQQQLAAGDAPPIVFITGHGDIPSSVRAMKAGAIEFLSKPFAEHELLQAIDTAIALDRTARRKRSELAELQKFTTFSRLANEKSLPS
jgi:FixJ family two-component response regulator